jgi:hypothetical protein
MFLGINILGFKSLKIVFFSSFKVSGFSKFKGSDGHEIMRFLNFMILSLTSSFGVLDTKDRG